MAVGSGSAQRARRASRLSSGSCALREVANHLPLHMHVPSSRLKWKPHRANMDAVRLNCCTMKACSMTASPRFTPFTLPEEEARFSWARRRSARVRPRNATWVTARFPRISCARGRGAHLFGSDSNIQIDILEDARELEYHLRMNRLERIVLANDGPGRRLFRSATESGAASLQTPADN